MTVGKRLGSRVGPLCPQGCPQLGLWAVEERVPELALSRSQTDDYLEEGMSYLQMQNLSTIALFLFLVFTCLKMLVKMEFLDSDSAITKCIFHVAFRKLE